jgi:hypothetical protein
MPAYGEAATTSAASSAISALYRTVAARQLNVRPAGIGSVDDGGSPPRFVGMIVPFFP